MIRSLLDTRHFAVKYGISPTQDNCRLCGVSVEVDIPVISKDFVGYESEDHGCGHAYIISVLKPRDNNLLHGFEDE
jgi:hypothetical protein